MSIYSMNKDNYIIHKNKDRGFSDHGWLQSAFSFSFAQWYEPTRMGFGTLRVINDDSIAPQNGFGFHPHQDMEIISILLDGELSHKDTMDNQETIKQGEVQRMSAGTGVLHSEMNNHKTKYAKLFQIWIETKKKGIKPSYEQKFFDEQKRKNTLQLLVSPNGQDGSVSIHQDAYISRIKLDKNKEFIYSNYHKDNGVYILIIEGEVIINSIQLHQRDAIGITNEKEILFEAKINSDILVLEIPMN